MEANLTWKDIAESYLRFVMSMGSQHLRIIVVFDGYGSSTKDHDHLRRSKNACCDFQIRPDLKNIVQREKFLDNKNNKSQLILFLAETFQRATSSSLFISSSLSTYPFTTSSSSSIASLSSSFSISLYVVCNGNPPPPPSPVFSFPVTSLPVTSLPVTSLHLLIISLLPPHLLPLLLIKPELYRLGLTDRSVGIRPPEYALSTNQFYR
ncbi:unnamed protein product [Gadus morhua 'NCC']